MVHAYIRKRGLERTGKRGAKKGQKEKRKRKERIKTQQKTSYISTGRRPILEGTRVMFAGTISPMTYLGDVPTEVRHDKTRRKARKKEKKRRKQGHRA